MIASAVQALDLKWSDVVNCRDRACLRRIEKASRRVLQIDWKPISVFPEEKLSSVGR